MGELEARTIPSVVERAAELFGAREGLVGDGRRLTFAELAAEVDRAARAYVAHGVRPGDRVAIWAPNVADWVIAALGAFRAAPATCGHAASSVTSPATSHRRDRTRSARTPVRRLAATTPSTMSATTAAHGRPRMATATVGAGPRRTIDRDTSGMRGGLRNVGARRPWARAASARERARRAKRRDVGSIAGHHRCRL